MKNELYHHGIKGQKWGVRRFQNEDGTLTSAGKKRLKLIRQVSDVAKKNSTRLYDEAHRVEKMNRDTHELYDDKDGWKKYATDVYGTTKGKEYGLSDNDFKKWMTDELKANLRVSDVADKNVIKRYSDAADKWLSMSKDLDSLSVEDASNMSEKDVKTLKAMVAMFSFMDVSLDDLITSTGDE